MENINKETIPQRSMDGTNGKVLNLSYYRIKKNLQEEGFDLITGKNGKLTVVLRMPNK